MTIRKAIFATGIAAAFAASAHPISPDSLIAAPVFGPAKSLLRNPDFLPDGSIETGAMGHPLAGVLAADMQVITAQKLMLGRLGMKPGECGTLLVMTGQYAASKPGIIAQTFTVAASRNGLIASRLNSSYSIISEGEAPGRVPATVDLGKWLNAYDYAYRLPTQILHTAKGVEVQVAVGKLKTCPN